MSVVTSNLSLRLADIVGSDHASSDPKHLVAAEVDGRRPAVVAWPSTVEEIAEVVKVAAAEKLAVIAMGARTKLGTGLPPREYEIALDLTRLDKIVAYDPGDLTLSVEAGSPLQKLAGVLAEQKQFLPLDVPWMKQTTVGGTIASGVDAPLRQLYGTARDYLIGLEFVGMDGVPVKSGGRVVKNVAGYDLHKLMIGALGTLGILTRINFRTFPLPEKIHGFVASFAKAEGALELRHRIARSPLSPMTLEVLSPGGGELFRSESAARLEAAPLPEDVLSPSAWALLVAFGGSEKVLARYTADLRRMAREDGAMSLTALGDNGRVAVWGRLREFLPIAIESSPASVILKLSVLPTRMIDALKEAASAAERSGLDWAALMRGCGVMFFVLLPRNRTNDEMSKSVAAANQIVLACGRTGANTTIPWCPSEWKPRLKIWGEPRSDFAQMEKLKKAFDPHGIFAPGRFVGGL